MKKVVVLGINIEKFPGTWQQSQLFSVSFVSLFLLGYSSLFMCKRVWVLGKSPAELVQVGENSICAGHWSTSGCRCFPEQFTVFCYISCWLCRQTEKVESQSGQQFLRKLSPFNSRWLILISVVKDLYVLLQNNLTVFLTHLLSSVTKVFPGTSSEIHTVGCKGWMDS